MPSPSDSPHIRSRVRSYLRGRGSDILTPMASAEIAVLRAAILDQKNAGEVNTWVWCFFVAFCGVGVFSALAHLVRGHSLAGILLVCEGLVFGAAILMGFSVGVSRKRALFARADDELASLGKMSSADYSELLALCDGNEEIRQFVQRCLDQGRRPTVGEYEMLLELSRRLPEIRQKKALEIELRERETAMTETSFMSQEA